MIYHFLTYLYQRNILSSVIKYIFLKNIIEQFEKSSLTQSKKGIFSNMCKRINEIIFECVLISFNGSNYDNILLANSLITIQTRLCERIKIFKKGNSCQTIFLSFNNNLQKVGNITKYKNVNIKKPVKKGIGKWKSSVFIKDIRNMVSQNLTLDKVGKLFNLEVSKLCFPYNQAVSIKIMKNIDSLRPNDEIFWKDTFSSRHISLSDRLHAQTIFNTHKFSNLYEYSVYYLSLDCLLLHSIVLKLFNTYLSENINLFVRRNFSQSNLSYQQFFIIEPSRQIKQNIAPKKIENGFLNYFIKQSLTGGLCTSFVHGLIDKDMKINEHLNYVDFSNYDKMIWPNFSKLDFKKKQFCEAPSVISTIDIRSLYPSAAVKKLPVSTPMIYTRVIPEDFNKVNPKTIKNLNLKGFCENVREHGNVHKDNFKLVNKRANLFSEYFALENYLLTLPNNIKIIRFQSNFTALGQLYFAKYPIDGFLSYSLEGSNKKFLKLIQYQSTYYHGHKKDCAKQNNDDEIIKYNKTSEVKNEINKLISDFHSTFNVQKTDIDIEYVELFDCDYFNHKIPATQKFTFYRNHYNYTELIDNVLNKNLTGFLVVKNLEIKKTAQNPLIGFIIQKIKYGLKELSPYSQQIIQTLTTSKRVVAVNKSKSFMVISTDYFVWLYKTFGFEKIPDIYHAIFFHMNKYLKTYIETKLNQRKQLKELIKNEINLEIRQCYEIKAELIKLMLNSCYGFTLCNLNSTRFRTFENRRFKNYYFLPKDKSKYRSCLEINNGIFLVEINKQQCNYEPFQTILGHIGCSILFSSKIILLKRLYFLLKYLSPTMAQLLYTDTDSAHFALKNKNFIDNVDPDFRPQFARLYDKHFDTGKKISGIWVIEGYYKSGNYIGEKCYQLSDNNEYLSHMKGLNNFFQKQIQKEHILIEKYPYINYNIFMKSSDFLIYKCFMSKNLFSNYIPIKRYFVFARGSLPLKF